ncbi:(5-formylfuran-3-yl)methyl phosphate synthase [Arenibaculum pallidiluteum]|uniref:(5-formylfuran-3-yl)methyl phosphate synthase n=1 Tax=Arenibaculum pallidiluteum TaxID=2812559 RepID=UPI001F2C9988|nr:(5-formylfuran-3-yl)methyl phosphate synthase [Arenibaculum pallidiluteum]
MRWLASVASAEEIATVLPAVPDILDLKDPSAGALGAWPVPAVARAVRDLRARAAAPLASATVGDLPMEPARVAAAVSEMARTGVDYVKVGLIPSGDPLGCLAELAPLCATGVQVVAVLFADFWPEDVPVAAAKQAGLTGVMLDTAMKGRGLPAHRTADQLRRFVDDARHRGLMTGLAGSLSLTDVPVLAECGADYLGFRGALCGASGRTAAIDPAAVAAVAAAVRAHGTRLRAG